jgi:Family of unknown function (DUF6064)
VQLPFTSAQFLDLFGDYNHAIWPAQALLLALGLGASVLAFRPRAATPRIVPACLAILWAWTGGVYHLTFFRTINPLASWFAILSLVQAVLFLRYAVRPDTLTFRASRSAQDLLGGLLLVYGFVVYPLLARALGHPYPTSATFGAPCPTTIVTIGLLLWAKPRSPRRLAVLPIVWAAVGSVAVIELGMVEDIGLTVAGLIGIVWLLLPRHRAASPVPA